MKKSLLGGAVIAAAALALGGCANNGLGYGYGRASYGYSYPARSYYGWYGSYYYPGTGYYLYDRYGTRHRWNDRERDYWQRRDGGRGHHHENWSGYHRDRNGHRDRRR